MSYCSRPGIRMLVRGVFEGVPRLLVCRQMIWFSLLLGHAMGMGANILQFGGPLVVLVMRSIVMTSGHVQRPAFRPGALVYSAHHEDDEENQQNGA
jgi:hypothetical protein